MALQPLIRRGTRSNATARRLIASSGTLAQHVIDTTIEDTRITDTVQGCKAVQRTTLAGIYLKDGQYFYLVASTFATRYYVVRYSEQRQVWESSATDKEVQARTIAAVLVHRQRVSQRAAAV